MKITNEANIFLTPSRREGCPMALLEAMRVGTIPITSDYDNGCKELIRDGYNGFVVPYKDIEGFVIRIIDIISNPDDYVNIYSNSYISFKRQLSFDVWKKKMDTLILHRTFQHAKRKEIFDSKLFFAYKSKQEKMCKYNMCHLLMFEYLPSAIQFLKYYLNFKVLKRK